VPAPGSPAQPSSAGAGITDLARFIRAQTRLAAPPLIPEIALWLSQAEPTVLWEHLEQASGRSDLPPPFWAYPWTGGIALARYLLDHPDQVAGQTVLDLASGSGLVAIVAARLGAAEVTASDIDPVAITAIGLNAEANGVTLTVCTADLLTTPSADRTADHADYSDRADGTDRADHRWSADRADHPGPGDADRADHPDHMGRAGHPDHSGRVGHPDHFSPSGLLSHTSIVLVGDAFYERRMAHRALGFLRRMREAGARVLIGDPGRAYLPPDLKALASYPVPAWAGLEDTEIKPSTVWELA
jgi:predicted nicotinamide N-methyase